ncbi:MAG: DUF4912 domain-containing protein [Treponema sp.]|jgi:hypothetical protein|nr:DUF4912 domain-containing protein [Treponema sp.]
MDELHLTRSGLESMSTAELVRVADSFGIDIPPGLDRVFVIEELLDLASLRESLEEEASFESRNAGSPPAGGSVFRSGAGGEGESGAARALPENLPRDTGVYSSIVFFPGEGPDAEVSPRGAAAGDPRQGFFGKEDFPGSVPFPKQYNITFIEVMIRDPLWAFAFWEVKEHDRETFERTAGFDGYCLRISPPGEDKRADSLSGFTVPVGPEDTAWYIGFPSENTGRRFQVELCVSLGDRIDVLASSRIFTMPRLQERSGQPGRRFGELALLSGAEEFPVLRNPERKIRLRHGPSWPGK